MQFWFYFLSFSFVLFFNDSFSSSIRKLAIRSEIYNCTFKNTNKSSFHYYFYYYKQEGSHNENHEPHFPLENPNLEKKHLTPTLSFLSSEWLILLILLQFDLSLTWIVQSYFRKKLFELFPRSHLMLTLMLYSKVCKYWNSSSSWKVIGGWVGEQGGRIPPNKNLEGGRTPPPHTHTHTHTRARAYCCRKIL